MSEVHISITRIRAMHTTANVPTGLPLQHSTVVGTSENITSSAVNQVSTLEVAREVTKASGEEAHSYIWCIVNSGADDIYAVFGTGTPTASVAGHKILANTTRFFSADVMGEKVAIINV